MKPSELLDSQRSLIVLVPGFVTLSVARSLSNLGEPQAADLFLLYLAASMLSVGTASLLVHRILVYRNIALSIDELLHRSWYWIACVVSAILWGVVIATAYEGAWMNAIAQETVGHFLGLKNFPKISPHETIDELLRTTADLQSFPDNRSPNLMTQEKILRVVLKDGGGTVVGWGFRSTIWSNPQQIFLSPACEEKDKVLVRIYGPGVWIPLNFVVRIDFLDAYDVKCEEDQRRGP